MMEIRVFFTKTGQMMGILKEETPETITIENPVILAPTGTGMQMIPLLMATSKQVCTFNRDELNLNGELFEAMDELRNHYSSQFGSGIQLLT